VSDKERYSEAASASLITDPIEEAQRESENAIAQFDRVLDLIDDVVRGDRPFRLRTSVVLELHRLGMEGLSLYAGNYRPAAVTIVESKHVTPPAHLVPGLIEEMCDYVMDRFGSESALHLSAYVMWRLNWIHPFTDGNGRTSRALSYFVLCAKLGYRLPGQETIPEQIAADKKPYYDALEAADDAAKNGQIDLSELEALLNRQLATQLVSAYKDASDPGAGAASEKKLH
jgi:Fic family protein